MKKSILAILLVSLTWLASCKKESTAPVPVPVKKAYTVTYQFYSDNVTAANFSAYYTAKDGSTQTVKNISSGWTLTMGGLSGQYVSLSAQSFTMDANVFVEILYDGNVLAVSRADGAGTDHAYALTNGTLP